MNPLLSKIYGSAAGLGLLLLGVFCAVQVLRSIVQVVCTVLVAAAVVYVTRRAAALGYEVGSEVLLRPAQRAATPGPVKTYASHGYWEMADGGRPMIYHRLFYMYDSRETIAMVAEHISDTRRRRARRTSMPALLHDSDEKIRLYFRKLPEQNAIGRVFKRPRVGEPPSMFLRALPEPHTVRRVKSLPAGMHLHFSDTRVVPVEPAPVVTVEPAPVVPAAAPSVPVTPVEIDERTAGHVEADRAKPQSILRSTPRLAPLAHTGFEPARDESPPPIPPRGPGRVLEIRKGENVRPSPAASRRRSMDAVADVRARDSCPHHHSHTIPSARVASPVKSAAPHAAHAAQRRSPAPLSPRKENKQPTTPTRSPHTPSKHSPHSGRSLCASCEQARAKLAHSTSFAGTSAETSLHRHYVDHAEPAPIRRRLSTGTMVTPTGSPKKVHFAQAPTVFDEPQGGRSCPRLGRSAHPEHCHTHAPPPQPRFTPHEQRLKPSASAPDLVPMSPRAASMRDDLDEMTELLNQLCDKLNRVDRRLDESSADDVSRAKELVPEVQRVGRAVKGLADRGSNPTSPCASRARARVLASPRPQAVSPRRA
ncbi:uncharacterized protein V1510DRAFT_109038 [Dipodascopsis tothii]|uniref:uncharacterized protein n=1 Tax=Dipodascopsis tothii TaxID=44089 RepID=UPI0034CE2471